MSTTLTDVRFPVQTINSNHPGSEFGVVHLDQSGTQMSREECLSLLEEDGWSSIQEVPSAHTGVLKFLVSRKK